MSTTATAIGNYLTRGLEASLANTPIEDGKLRYTVDTGRCYLDYKDDNGNLKRIRITDVIFDYTEAQIHALSDYGQNLYIANDTATAFYNVDGVWKAVGALTLVQSSEDKDYVLWFSGENDSKPLYNTGLKYNPSTNTISVGTVAATTVKVGTMVITETITEEMDHIVDFKFV